MRTFKNNAELEREIDRVEQIIDQSKSNYLSRDLTRYLRRLQKERFLRQRAWEKQEKKNWNKKLKR